MRMPTYKAVQSCQDFFKEPTSVDFRKAFSKGERVMCWAPGPTGQCFRRSLLGKILPMPESDSVTLGDRYVEYASFYSSPGIQAPDLLAFQRVHGSNLFTFKPEAPLLSAIIGLKTAFHLRDKFPQFASRTDQMFGSSFGYLLGKIGLKETLNFAESKRYIIQYLPLNKWVAQAPRMVLNFIRAFVHKKFNKQLPF